MSTFSPAWPRRSLIAVLSLVLLAALLVRTNACARRTQIALPLLVISGPDNFVSFEVNDSTGETLWRLEADVPSKIEHVVYATVPPGFRQVYPKTRAPRPLQIGEDLIMVSRIPTREFVHTGFANTESTVTVLGSEMRRIGNAEKE